MLCHSQSPGLWEQAKSGFSFEAQALGYAAATGVLSGSLFNPNNDVAHLPDTSFTFEFRPELRWTLGIFSVGVKPRVGGTNGESHHFVFIRVRIVRKLFCHRCKTQGTDE